MIGPDPSPLERLLIDGVVARWLQVHHADLAAARPGDRTAEGLDRMTRRQSAADRRYAGAIEALARLRRTPSAAAPTGPVQEVTTDGSVASAHEPADVVPSSSPPPKRGSSGVAGATERVHRRRTRGS